MTPSTRRTLIIAAYVITAAVSLSDLRDKLAGKGDPEVECELRSALQEIEGLRGDVQGLNAELEAARTMRDRLEGMAADAERRYLELVNEHTV